MTKSNFKDTITRGKGIKIIAEIKTQSPSQGPITLYTPCEIAREYEKSKASVISVLTDKTLFGGSLKDMRWVQRITTKPILRKDFIMELDQVYESKAYGADAILLIASNLTAKELEKIIDLSRGLGMECLVECHTKEDIEKVPETADIYGINNRDLSNPGKPPDLDVTKNLIGYIPKGKIIVSESGIRGREDIDFLNSLDRKVDAVLVGTSILKSNDMIGFINRLLKTTTI